MTNNGYMTFCLRAFIHEMTKITMSLCSNKQICLEMLAKPHTLYSLLEHFVFHCLLVCSSLQGYLYLLYEVAV